MSRRSHNCFVSSFLRRRLTRINKFLSSSKFNFHISYDYKIRSAVQISRRLKSELTKHLGTPVKSRET